MRLIFNDAILLCAVVLAWRRGGPPERWFAFILAMMFAVDRSGHALLGTDRNAILWLHAAIDWTATLAMARIAIEARRVWPLCALALQMLCAAIQLAYLLAPDLDYVAVTIASITFFPLICLILIGGTIAHRRRLKRGPDRSWRRSSTGAMPTTR